MTAILGQSHKLLHWLRLRIPLSQFTKVELPKKQRCNWSKCFIRPLTYIAREVNRRQYLLMSIPCICNEQRSIAIHRQWQERSQQQARNRGGRQYETSTDTLVSWYCRPVLAFHKLLTLVCMLSNTCRYDNFVFTESYAETGSLWIIHNYYIPCEIYCFSALL